MGLQGGTIKSRDLTWGTMGLLGIYLENSGSTEDFHWEYWEPTCGTLGLLRIYLRNMGFTWGLGGEQWGSLGYCGITWDLLGEHEDYLGIA